MPKSTEGLSLIDLMPWDGKEYECHNRVERSAYENGSSESFYNHMLRDTELDSKEREIIEGILGLSPGEMPNLKRKNIPEDHNSCIVPGDDACDLDFNSKELQEGKECSFVYNQILRDKNSDPEDVKAIKMIVGKEIFSKMMQQISPENSVEQ